MALPPPALHALLYRLHAVHLEQQAGGIIVVRQASGLRASACRPACIAPHTHAHAHTHTPKRTWSKGHALSAMKIFGGGGSTSVPACHSHSRKACGRRRGGAKARARARTG